MWSERRKERTLSRHFVSVHASDSVGGDVGPDRGVSMVPALVQHSSVICKESHTHTNTTYHPHAHADERGTLVHLVTRDVLQ